MTTAEDLAIRGIDEVEPLDVEGSAIFRGRQRTHNRQVAVKILDPLQEPLVPRRFDIRRKALNRFAEQPGVVPVYEVGSSPDGSNYLVMPYFRIGSLADQLSHGPTPWHRAAELVMNAARIVGRGHELGVVLGDLKPSSILLADASSPLIALYGMATRRFDNGSPRYAAPETLQGATPGPSADVYSLALTLAALIAGRPPTRGHPAPEFMADVARLAPARIVDVIDQGLSDNQAYRYGTCNHLARALELALAAEPEVSGGSEPDADPIDWDSLLGPASAPVDNGPENGNGNGAHGGTVDGAENGNGRYAAYSPAGEPEPDELVIDLTDGAITGDDDDPLGLDSGWSPDRPVPRPPAPPGSTGSGNRTTGGSATLVDIAPPGITPRSADSPSPDDVMAPAAELDPEATIAAAELGPAAAIVAPEPEPASGIGDGTDEGEAGAGPAPTALVAAAAPLPAVVAPPLRPAAWLPPDRHDPGPGHSSEQASAAVIAEADTPTPGADLAAPIPVDDQIPFPAFERQPLPVPPENPVLRYWDTIQGAWFNRRRSYGGLLAVLGLAVIAGVVVWLLVRDLKPPTNVAPGSTFTTFIDSSDASSNPTAVPPVLQEPPATNTTVPAVRPKPKSTAPKRTTTSAAPTASSAAPSAPATTAAPATTPPPASTVPATTAPATTRGPRTTAPPATSRPTLTISLPTFTLNTKPPNTGTTAAPQGLTLPLIDTAEVTRIRATSARIGVTSGSCVTVVFSYAAVGEAARQIPSSSCATAHTLLLGIVTPSLRSGTSYTVTVTVTDAAGHTASQALSFTTLG
ncbi:MAG: protein kinase [Acidimicrobiales bacterium]